MLNRHGKVIPGDCHKKKNRRVLVGTFEKKLLGVPRFSSMGVA